MKKLLLVLNSLMLSVCVYAQPSGNSFACNSGVGYVSVPDNNFIDLQDSITVEMWINSCDTIGAEFDLLTKGWCQPDDAAYYFYVSAKKLHWQYIPTGSGFCSNIVTISSSNAFLLTPNTWYHVALSHSSIGGVTMYVNGTAVPSTYVSGSASAIRNSAEPLLINVYKNFTGNLSNSISGKIDEIRLWKKVRSASDISTSMNTSLTGNESGLVAYYKFEQTGSGSGITVANSAVTSGTVINGTTAGTVTGVPSFVSYNNVIGACAFTGVESLIMPSSEIYLFPNPASDLVVIKSKNDTEIKRAMILDLFGRIILDQTNSSNELNLNVSKLSQGFYTVIIDTANGVFSQKLVIEK